MHSDNLDEASLLGSRIHSYAQDTIAMDTDGVV